MDIGLFLFPLYASLCEKLYCVQDQQKVTGIQIASGVQFRLKGKSVNLDLFDHRE
jgi:hypothetical protein